MHSFFYLILAILGLGFLVFIHELGHYFAALRVGMRVEAFGIGFGKAIYSWTAKNGVEWRINWLPFGGYVKIAGMEKEDDVEPSDIPDGFFGKSPIDRIKVALAGPVVNLVFALLAFTALWGLGGREKNFEDFSSRAGWVDPASELYEGGVRPGDIISSYEDKPVVSFKDHLYAAMMGDGDIKVKGYHVDYDSGQQTAFQLDIAPYSHPSSANKEILTTGILKSASYVLYPEKDAYGKATKLMEGSPMENSGIKPGDRIVWANGEKIFSVMHLQQVINEDKVLLTVERGPGEIVQVRVPRVAVEELRFGAVEKDEIVDWQFESGLRAEKLGKLLFLPYNLNPNCLVEGRLPFVDEDVESQVLTNGEELLRAGDRVIAVDGVSVRRAHEVLKAIQARYVNIIVSRMAGDASLLPSDEADAAFDGEINWSDISKLASTIGTASPLETAGTMVALKRVQPKRSLDFARSEKEQKRLEEGIRSRVKLVEEIADPELRRRTLAAFHEAQERLLIGLPLTDRKVTHNPEPFTLFGDVFDETFGTLRALFSGHISPKWLAGPVGIVQVIQHHWMLGIQEALYWIAAISLNLGTLNLLPIPVLDGGHICFAIWEMVTGRKLSSKTMERLIIPFAVVLIGFLVFLTYHDVSRIFSGVFG